jgi:hypothetical protein
MRPSVESDFTRRVAEESTRPHAEGTPIRAEELTALPPPVRRYLEQAGVVGKPRPWNMRVEFDAEMRKDAKSAPMAAVSDQYNFFGDPTRLFFMRARMFGLPVAVLHDYSGNDASMVVRVAGLFNMVDLRGTDLRKAETVTVLNDMCVLAPGSLLDARLTWLAMDEARAQVTFANGANTVKAVLHFNERGELVNFFSDDRLARGDDGVLHAYRFSTPLRDYRDFGGYRLAGHGEAVWHYPEGEFAYGKFDLKRIAYNVAP